MLPCGFILLLIPYLLTSVTSVVADDSIPITQAYPGVFSPDPNILVTNVNIHGVPGFKVNPFPDSRRNHYDSRNGAKIKYLIMHFTEETFPNTVNIFTNGSSSDTNRVSAHYVISEKAQNIGGGQVLQVVPDDLRAWHAGVSTWGPDNNLNYISLGIEHVNLGYTGNYGNNETYFPYDDDQMKASGLCEICIIFEKPTKVDAKNSKISRDFHVNKNLLLSVMGAIFRYHKSRHHEAIRNPSTECYWTRRHCTAKETRPRSPLPLGKVLSRIWSWCLVG